MWLGTVALLLSIFYTGIRKKAGFYLGLIGGITVTIANVWTHLVRGTTSDYLVGGALGLAVIVFLMIPAFKKRLFDEAEPAYSTGE
jgi:4-hydroxybenzoate polyprenyltransferase